MGLEHVLFMAASDEGFREALFRDREAALEASGVNLRSSERLLLQSIPDAHLRSATSAVDLSPENIERRGFLKGVAASVAALAGQVVSGCDTDAPGVVADVHGVLVDGGHSDSSPMDLRVDIRADRSAGVDAGMPDSPLTAKDAVVEFPVDSSAGDMGMDTWTDLGAEGGMPDTQAPDDQSGTE